MTDLFPDGLYLLALIAIVMIVVALLEVGIVALALTKFDDWMWSNREDGDD